MCALQLFLVIVTAKFHYQVAKDDAHSKLRALNTKEELSSITSEKSKNELLESPIYLDRDNPEK